MDAGFHTNPGLDGVLYLIWSRLEVGTVGTVCVKMRCDPRWFVCGSSLVRTCWVDDGFHTNPGLDGMFDQSWSRLEVGSDWHSLCFGLHVWGDQVWWMMGFTPIQAWMAIFTSFFRF